MTLTLHVAKPPSLRTPLRWLGAVVLLAALAFGVSLQRSNIVGAVGEIRSMSLLAIAALIVLAAFERWVRADIVRTLMNTAGPGRTKPLSLGAALTVHDVGTAASKALPLGGAVGTAMRWSIARRGDISAARFTSVFVSYGVASTLIAWMLPLIFLIVDVGHGSGDRNDWLLIASISTVLGTGLVVGGAMLRSDRIEGWLTARLGMLSQRVRRRQRSGPRASAPMPADAISVVRTELRAAARRPWMLLIRTAAAQCSGAMVLLISLRAVGVGDELGIVEFARVFFVAQLLGSFIPTPGGVGVVEAGMTGALVAAGVDLRLALASVLVYRLITYVVPIIVGFVLYLRWRIEPVEPAVVTAIEPIAVVVAPRLAVAS